MNKKTVVLGLIALLVLSGAATATTKCKTKTEWAFEQPHGHARYMQSLSYCYDTITKKILSYAYSTSQKTNSGWGYLGQGATTITGGVGQTSLTVKTAGHFVAKALGGLITVKDGYIWIKQKVTATSYVGSAGGDWPVKLVY
jgi:hypothetical protein